MKATVETADELYRQVRAKRALVTPDTAEAPPAWFGAAKKYLAPGAKHAWSAVRESIERGWAGELVDRRTG